MLKHIPFYASLLGKALLKGKSSTTSHVLLYGAIEVHAMGEKGCIASNETLAAETGLKINSVGPILSAISKAGWVKVVLSSQNKRLEIIPLIEASIPEKSALTEVKAKDSALTRVNAEHLPGLNILDRLDTEYIDKSISSKAEKKKYDEKDVEMVNLMFEQMHLNYPDIRQKEPRPVDYEIMNKLHRLDGNDYELIKAVIMWSQQDDFWKQNIRSVNKLRIKFDDLRIRGQAWFNTKQKNRIVEI